MHQNLHFVLCTSVFRSGTRLRTEHASSQHVCGAEHAFRDRQHTKRGRAATRQVFYVKILQHAKHVNLQHANRVHLQHALLSPCTTEKILNQKSDFAIFLSHFFTAAIFLASSFGFTSFCLQTLELSQSILIHRPRSKVNNELFFFVKTTSASSV